MDISFPPELCEEEEVEEKVVIEKDPRTDPNATCADCGAKRSDEIRLVVWVGWQMVCLPCQAIRIERNKTVLNAPSKGSPVVFELSTSCTLPRRFIRDAQSNGIISTDASINRAYMKGD